MFSGALNTLVLLGLLPLGAAAAPDLWPGLTREREVEVALSAAPEHLRDGAGVYVLGEEGFERVRESVNGFNCLANRVGVVFAPVCYDAEGSRTTLLADLRRGQLRAAGMGTEEIAAVLSAEYERRSLEGPARPGIAYMLSESFFAVDPESGERTTVFPPHLMFYAPYLDNEDIGALPEHTNSTMTPWILSPGSPSAYIIVAVSGQEPPTR